MVYGEGGMSRARRRRFLIASGALLAAPLGRAQRTEKVRRVAMLVTSIRSGANPYMDATRAGLRERGWTEGENLVLDLLSADGNTDRFPELAAEMVARKPDVIFATTYLAVLAVTFETDTIPVVFAAISDPVKAGLVKNLARPGAGSVVTRDVPAGAFAAGNPARVIRKRAVSRSRRS
jgi:putative ABC transport system substrate-binding protein